MFVYSKKIIRFVHEIKHIIREVLSQEIGLKISQDRFYDRRQQSSYVIKVVVYDNRGMLGYFDPTFYELGFHECLMYSSREQLRTVIRHELAHYITFINHGKTEHAHSPEFRTFCLKMGWGEEVYAATFRLDGWHEDSHRGEKGVLRKIQKLLALATSSNTHEAECAMIKSQQLLLKYNLESTYIGGDDEEKLFIKRLFKQKKVSAKMHAIAAIVGTFFVSIIYKRAEDGVYFEIVGNAVNVEIAEYVVAVLQHELEALWEKARLTACLKGTVAKNSFFRGLAKGYCDKIEALQKGYTHDVSKALMVMENKLTEAKSLLYPHLSSTRSSASHCHESSFVGEQMGKKLTIHPSISKAQGSSFVLLS